jgi:DegV family protein with EDD domain
MTPKKIALLTDSSADLRWDQARENNIFFVPLRILCEDGEYLDGVNITGPDIYQRLHNGELPQTSLPRVEDFSAKLREIFDLGYDGVIAVMLDYEASYGEEIVMLPRRFPLRFRHGGGSEQGYAMKVFDSVSGALGQGMTVLQLAEDIKNGMDWEELTERRAPQLIANTYPFFSVDTLEYLVKGGRIGKVTAMAGTMLQIKPIITFAPDGQLQSVAKVRGRHQVMRKLVDMAVDRCGEHKRYNLAVAHGGAPEEMETVRQMLTEALPNSDHLWDGEIDGTLSVYIGDGVLGAAVQVLD